MAHAAEYHPKILVIDSQGQPVRWALMQRAARYYAAGKVVTELGDAAGIAFPLATPTSASPSTGCSRATARSAPTAAATSPNSI